MELRGGPEIEIAMYSTLSEAINDLKNLADTLERRVEALKQYRDEIARREKTVATILQILEEAGKEIKIPESYIEVTGMRIYIDPRPYEELRIIDEALSYMADRVNVIRKAIAVLEELANRAGLSNVRTYIQFRVGVPVKIVLKQ